MSKSLLLRSLSGVIGCLALLSAIASAEEITTSMKKEGGDKARLYSETEKETQSTLIDRGVFPMGKGKTSPYMKGTFVDFWYKSKWTSKEWEGLMEEMEEIGIETLIVQFSAYEDQIWVESENDYSTRVHPEALSLLLDAAAKFDMGVYVGLYFKGNYWRNATNIEELETHATRCKEVAKAVWEQNKDRTSFRGWYIPHEPAPYYYRTPEDLAILKDHLINPIADYCKELSAMPVSISAFFNYKQSSTEVFAEFMKGLASTNVELIILQDGVGVDHCDLDVIESYYAAANKALYEDSDFKGAFWADLETFKGKVPDSMEVFSKKLEAVKDHVSYIVTFQYFSDMSPASKNGDLAKKLRDDYLEYLKQDLE